MWQKILQSFLAEPRDVHTVPTTTREPIWFNVFVEKGELYVESAHHHTDSSSISKRRRLNEKLCQTMLSLYHRRIKGESVHLEATRLTMNQVYWYGIFNELNL